MVSSDSEPLIGITGYAESARFGVWDTRSLVLHQWYLDAVVAGGGMPVVLPPVGQWHARHVARLDGLVLAGGADVDPARYGASRDPAAGAPRADRDDSEFTLLELALRAEVPVLGVCRGLHVLNVALGGTLHQHLPDVIGSTAHLPAPGRFGRVAVDVARDSVLARAVGSTVSAHCHHHQATDRLGEGLRVVASAADGTVEAVELDAPQFVLAVQWHPEADTGDPRLFGALVRAAHGRKR